jgi:molecular chaperone DnaK
VHVLQGERALARDNRTLGNFQLTGLPPAPRGVPQIEVTFDIDANGIVNVSAKDRATGSSQAITISGSTGLAREEVERMVAEAASHADEDRERRDEAETRNRLDGLVFGVEKMLDEHRERLTAEETASLTAALEGARQALADGGREPMEAALQELTRSSNKVGEVMYQRAAAETAAREAAGPASAEGSGDAPAEGGGAESS